MRNLLLFCGICLLFSCQKELYFDIVPPAVDTIKTAQGYLGGAPNACTPVKIFGSYEKGFAFDTSHHVNITATLTHGGPYSIYTNTVNGMYFKDSGSFTSTGTKTVSLKAYGTPADTGSFVFTVHFNSSVCSFILHVGIAENVDTSDYFPNTPGSWWKYENNNITRPDSMFWACTNFRNTINGNSYSLFTRRINLFKADTVLIRKANGNYIEYGRTKGLSSALATSYNVSVLNREMIFLKDYLPVGGSWDSDTIKVHQPPSQDFTFYTHFVIVEKGVSVAVNGTNFNNVITVQVSDYVDKLDGQGFHAQSLMHYNSYAKNIGLIKTTSDIVIAGEQIVSYFIH